VDNYSWRFRPFLGPITIFGHVEAKMVDLTLLPNACSVDAAEFNIIGIWNYHYAGEGKKFLACLFNEFH